MIVNSSSLPSSLKDAGFSEMILIAWPASRRGFQAEGDAALASIFRDFGWVA
jgi:hypothetical protein